MEKQTSLSALEAWTRVFDMVDPKLGRVGKLSIHDEDILQEFQELLPDKTVKFAIACRGSNRTIAPSKMLHSMKLPSVNVPSSKAVPPKYLLKMNGRTGKSCPSAGGFVLHMPVGSI